MRHSPARLFITFTFIGLSGFGGVLPWARRTLVEQKQWLSSQEFNALLGVCQLVPGPNIVNLAVCVGERFGGVRGAFSAVGGLMLAPMTVVILLAYSTTIMESLSGYKAFCEASLSWVLA